MKILILLFAITFSSLFSQNWKESTPLPAGTESRNHPITFSIDKYGYYLTGYGITENLLKDFYRFDSETEEWEQLPDFPGVERGFAYGVSYDGKGYVGFGVNKVEFLKDLWEYDPETEEWTQLESCPCVERRHPALVAANGRVFVGLGNNQFGNLNDWWEYNIETKTWRELPNLPSFKRHHPYYFEIGNDVYVGLGDGSGVLDEHGKYIYKSWFKWDTETDEWTRMKDFPGEGRVAGTQFSHQNKGYVLSGQGDDHFNLEEGEFFQYDPVEDSWLMLESHPGNSSRWAPGSFVIADTVYFTSGRSLFSPVVEHADLWKFTLPNNFASVGVDESLFSFYPNPTKDFINLNLVNRNISKIEISNVKGDVVYTTNTFTNRIDISNYSEGAYFISIYSDNKSDTKKFIVKR